MAVRGAVRAQDAAPAPPGLSPQAIAQIQSVLLDKARRSRVQRKFDSQLISAVRQARRQPAAAGVPLRSIPVRTAPDGRLIVDVRARMTASLDSELRRTGARVVWREVDGGMVRVQATPDQIEALAAHPDVLYVQPMQEAVTNREHDGGQTHQAWLRRRRAPGLDRAGLTAAIRKAVAGRASGTNAGSVQSEGDLTHKASAVRAWNIDGTGVKIGVLSDGVTSLAVSQATGDLPNVTVVPNQAGSGDEGTAMLEIVHDLAPGAELFFATAFNGITSFANNIRTLRNTYGCDIIIDDVFYYVETPFQDGQTSSVVSTTNGAAVIQAVKDVTADGALYFSSAGNSGNLNDGTSGTWEGDFAAGGTITIPNYGTKPIHDFGGQSFNVLTSNGLGSITFYWADPLGGSSNDYDIFLLDSTGSFILSFSTGNQDGTQDPYERIVFDRSSSAFANARIVIVQWSGVSRFMHVSTNRGRLSIATAGEIHGHAATNAANAFGVAATPARSPGPSPNPFSGVNTVETFSSDGPRRIFFNDDGSAITPGNFSSTGGQVLAKPDLTAADRVSVTGAGDFPTVFSGTSAAAPHAGAIAALIKSADPSLTASQVRAALLSSAIDIEAPGLDRDSGAGIVMADTAVTSVASPAMALDAPATGTVQVQPFTLAGWAVDRRAPSGTGVDTVHVWAYPVSSASGGTLFPPAPPDAVDRGGPQPRSAPAGRVVDAAANEPQFVGVASYGGTRSDVAAVYGARFAGSGYSLSITGLAPGTYTLVVAAHSTVTSDFNQSRATVVTIPVTAPAMSVDTPANGASIGPSFTVAGWAVDRAAGSGSGIDAIHIYAFPRTADGFGAGIFLGAATLGLSRPDVGAVFGSQFSHSGYVLQVPGLGLGEFRVMVYARSTVTGTFNQAEARDITVAANPAMALDTPQAGARGQPFLLAGWAVDLAAPSGTGVDAVHVWAFPASGGSPVFAGQAALGGSRGDVGAVFGAQFTASGYHLTVFGLTPGQQYTLGVYARSTVTGTFNQARFVTVTIE